MSKGCFNGQNWPIIIVTSKKMYNIEHLEKLRLVFKIYPCCDFTVLVFQDKEDCIDHYIDIKFCVVCWNHMSYQIFAK